MMRSLLYVPGRPLQADLSLDELAAALKRKDGLLWVDFVDEPNETCEPILRDLFGFHPLAVDDALQETHTPKVDDWGEYLYIVANALEYHEAENVAGAASLVVHEVDIFLGPNYVVSHHDEAVPSVQAVWQACQRDTRHLQQGADHLLYKILDFLVADYLPIVARLDDALDEVEDRIFHQPGREVLSRLFALKRALLAMRRVITPQREVLNRLARDDYRLVDPRDRIFFRDVYDHLVRLHDLNESMRDLVSGAMDIYLSVINNRMNEVMKTLTMITTLFMPLSFIAAFFGMNFFMADPPYSNWMTPPVFYLTLGLLMVTPGLMYWWMRRRMWLE